MGCVVTCEAVPTDGSSIWPGVIIGAVTMKITSSTSMTSMYGTTLMSLFIRRLRLRPLGVRMSVHLPLENVQEFFHEALEADGQAVDLAGVAVVGQHGRDGGEQADGGCYQRLGDAGSDGRQRGLLHGRQPHEGVHDAPDRPEQAHVRTDRAGR